MTGVQTCALPISATLTPLAWQPGYAGMICRGTVKGEPWPLDTRNILIRQIERLSARGWTLNVGLEPEFMLLRRRPDGSLGPIDETDGLAKAAYDYKGLARTAPVLEAISEALEQAGFDVIQIDHEDANGQFEINYRFADALTSADRMIFVKMAAGEIAHRAGAICSFMPKPRSDATGNGMHVHCSIADADGRNLFHDAADPTGLGLSKLARHFLAGLLHHAAALTALTAPTVNSYKRLVVGRTASGATWAPVYVAYGDNNRTSMVRIPHGRLEYRVGDSAMNPYLGLAALIAAGLDGIERELDPGPAHDLNFYELSPAELAATGVKTLPQSLHEAIEALEADPLFADALGADFIAEFVALKRAEWIDYHRHVSEWEVERYLTFF